ncbi:hypothetical protein L7F22_047469 [Adiantum nelumboides]|nr:hypothetical protein [Adiantum nelumboides]
MTQREDISQNTIQINLNIISSQGLKRSRFGPKLQAYALAWIEPHTRLATHVDKTGDADPTWNTTLTFFVNKHLASKSLILIEIFNRGHLSDTLLGSVGVVVSNLLNKNTCQGGTQLCALQIRRASERAHRILNIGSMIIHPKWVDSLSGVPHAVESMSIYKEENGFFQSEENEAKKNNDQDIHTYQEVENSISNRDSQGSPPLQIHQVLKEDKDEIQHQENCEDPSM